VNENQLGGFGSSIHYDPASGKYWALADRGPGGGVVPFETRVHVFDMDIDPITGTLSNFVIEQTIPLKTADGSAHFNGLAPGRLNGDSSVLGLSFDPEGLAFAPNGNLIVADEYGPSIYEFSLLDTGGSTEARFVRAFANPVAVVPRNALEQTDYDAVRSPLPADPANTLITGRQDNRGYEGVTVTPDGTSVFAILQGPLAEEGANDQGRNSRNTRIVKFDYVTGSPTQQFIYELTPRAEVNAVIDQSNADPAADIGGSAQGRSIVVSDLLATSNTKFLVIERENRGIGSDNPAGADPILSASGLKSVYEIDISEATDVSQFSLKGTNDLVTPLIPGNPDPPVTILSASKTLYLDVLAELKAAGNVIPEKIESLTFGPRLADGSPTLILASDNDVSVSQATIQIGGQVLGRQFEIFTMGSETRWTDIDDASRSYVNINDPANASTYLVDQGPLPIGFERLPSYIYSFAAIPEPSASLIYGIGAAAVMALYRRRMSN
jgi:hypothetical protein